MKQFLKTINQFLKKFHIIKWIVFLTLLFSVIFSGYLLFLAKTTNVVALKDSLEQQTIIYDQNSNEIGALRNQKGTYVQLDNISQTMIDAVITTEDKRFYEHAGVDYLGIARNVVGFVMNGFKISGGGSTLSQQLAKNSYLTQRQTLIRKAQELFLAKEIERVYTKDEILTMYLNHAYFGHGVWGVEDASKKYFGKSAKLLPIDEAATLTGMLKGPSLYNPIDNPELAKSRRQVVLQLLLENQKITEEQYTKANDKAFQLVDRYEETASYRYPYFFDAVIEEAAKQYQIADEDLFSKGYKIYTTLNTDYQNQIEIAYKNTQFKKAKDGVSVQSATVVADSKTGAINAMIGGIGTHTYRGFNRATQMYRQPGSTIKPLVVYAPAIINGYTPESILLDEVQSYGADNYTPNNVDLKTEGSLPMYQAIAKSKNTSAVWLLDKIGLDLGIKQLNEFGIETTAKDHHLALALGGMDRGVTLLALNNAYTAFADDGMMHSPFLITKIIDASGNVIVDKKYASNKQVLTKETAETMTKMLMGVYETGGTGEMTLPNQLKIAGKTGTTDNNGNANDFWSVAYTKDFVVTSWMGFDNPDSEHHLNLENGDSIKPLFNRIVKQLLTVSPQTRFDVTSVQSDVTQREYEESQKLENQIKKFGQDMVDSIQNGLNHVWDFFKNFGR